MRIKTIIFSCHTADSKPVKTGGQRYINTSPLVFPVLSETHCNCIFKVKNTFGFTILYCTVFNIDDKSYSLRGDLDQQFSAPFKAGNSGQVQTCYKPTVQTQRKLQHFLVCTGTGEMGVLVTLKH